MPSGRRRATAALRHRDFALFWSAALVSNSGTWMQNVAVPFVLFQITHNAAWVGFASFAQFIPGVVLAPVAGRLADRFSRRTVLIVTQSALGITALTLWFEYALGARSPWLMTATLAVSGTLQALSIAAWQAYVTELVPREDLLNAVTLNSAQFSAARAIGPAIGGVVLVTLGAGGAFFINAVSYVVVVAAVVLVRTRRSAADTSEPMSIIREFASTIRYVRGRRGIVTCCIGIGAVGLLGWPLFSLIAVFAEDVFGVSGVRYGLLSACLGIGAILAVPLIAGPGSVVRRSQLAGASLGAYAVAVVAFGAAPSYWFAAIGLLLAGASHLAMASALNTAIQLQVDETMRGKVLAFYLMVLTAAIPFGSLVQGVAAEAFGPQPAVVTAGVLLGGVVAWLAVSGRLATLDDEIAEVGAAPPAVPIIPSPDLDAGEVLPPDIALIED